MLLTVELFIQPRKYICKFSFYGRDTKVKVLMAYKSHNLAFYVP